jgi:hypothetical protein
MIPPGTLHGPPDRVQRMYWSTGREYPYPDTWPEGRFEDGRYLIGSSNLDEVHRIPIAGK